METKQAVFERYQAEYFKDRKRSGKRKEITAIINTVASVTGLGRKSIIRSFKHRQMRDPAEAEGRGISATSPSQLKHIIPIFHGDWSLKLPGTGQIDTVVHCGNSLKGDMVFTLNYPDIPTLWCLLRAQWNKGQESTKDSLATIKTTLPWTLLEVHPDTGSEFINWLMKDWCDIHHIIMTRSRPNYSNDNMPVKERNGHIVRKWIGYQRLDCPEAVAVLNAVYDVLCPYLNLNHFVTSRRVIKKYEVEGKWKKRYEKVAKTLYQRVQENEYIPKDVKKKLQQEHATLNPLTMLKEMERLNKVLYDTQRKYSTTNQ